MKISDKDLKRFWDNVDRKFKNECWIYGIGNNYGDILINGKKIKAHRFSYELHKGKIPKGMNVCHTCDIPACVNPNHLWIGTQKDNMQDKIKKGRYSVEWGKGRPENTFIRVSEDTHKKLKVAATKKDMSIGRYIKELYDNAKLS